jgi:murein DD-endopeptidase MepM/ murein hydrolase activator NlpD
MKTISYYSVTAILAVLLLLQLILGMFPEPARVILWYLLQAVLPILGGLSLFSTIVYLIRKQSLRSKKAWSLATLGIAAIVLPFAPIVMGWPYPARLEEDQKSAFVRVPLDGQVLVAWGGDKVQHNYHAAYPDQRWAYDLVIKPAFNQSTKLTDYGCYGKAVVAPANGKIIAIHDGEADMVPGKEIVLTGPATGNHIVLQIEGDKTEYLEIGHLQKGSLSVAKGAMVREGDVIGRCGNSGNTSEPHVHIHYMRGVSAQYDPDDIFYGLPLKFRNHNGRAMPRGGFDGEKPAGDIIQHQDE